MKPLVMIFALLAVLLMVACSKSDEPKQTTPGLIVVPRDVVNEDLSSLLPADQVPAGFTARESGAAIKDAGNSGNIVSPSYYATYADASGNLITLEVIVEADDATVAHHAPPLRPGTRRTA